MTPRTRRKRLPHLLDARKVALASFLDVDVKTIIAHPVRHDSIAKMNARFECTLGSKGDEFLVLIEKEAAEMTREEMDDVLWTLRPEFLVEFMDGLSVEHIAKIQQALGEEANPVIEALLKAKRGLEPYDHFQIQAMLTKGYGHFLSPVDGTAHEQDVRGFPDPFLIFRV